MGAICAGSDERNEALFSYVNLEDRVPARPPLRLIREIVNAVARLDGAFDKLYAADGRKMGRRSVEIGTGLTIITLRRGARPAKRNPDVSLSLALHPGCDVWLSTGAPRLNHLRHLGGQREIADSESYGSGR